MSSYHPIVSEEAEALKVGDEQKRVDRCDRPGESMTEADRREGGQADAAH